MLLRHAVPLTSVNGYDYTLKIEGRADGIIADISEDEEAIRHLMVMLP